MTREALSVVVITRDAARVLGPCLESAAFAEEIVVVDAGSTDATLEVARRHGARTVHQEWLGFGRQKQFAVAQAAHDWVLCLDADERVSGALRQAIERELAAPRHFAYRMPRRNRFMGRWLRHGEGYPDYSLRLFHRGHARWSDDEVHERVVSEAAVGILAGDLLHESEDGLEEYLRKQNRYTSLHAEALFRQGVRATAPRLVLSPLARFVKFYVLRRGFLDGIPGLVHIAIGCFNSMMKYAKLMERQGAGKTRQGG